MRWRDGEGKKRRRGGDAGREGRGKKGGGGVWDLLKVIITNPEQSRDLPCTYVFPSLDTLLPYLLVQTPPPDFAHRPNHTHTYTHTTQNREQ